MKIISWNCNQGLISKKKYEDLLDLKSDIAIIQECLSPDKIKSNFGYKQFLWKGTNPNKGIGIFSFNDEVSLNIHDSYTENFKYIVPIEVKGKVDFILFAIWAMRGENSKLDYSSQIYLALNYYKELINEKSIIIGDFNSNKKFKTNRHRIGSFMNIVDFLSHYKIQSLYHYIQKEEFGNESIPTHFYRHNSSSPFHIDYCFVSDYFIDKLNDFSIGKPQQWSDRSDHFPLIIDFK